MLSRRSTKMFFKSLDKMGYASITYFVADFIDGCSVLKYHGFGGVHPSFDNKLTNSLSECRFKTCF